MLHDLTTIDLIVVVVLILFIVVASMYSSFKKKDAEEYFMAGRSLKWYSVAGSIFGTNIHAQQIIGMMGVGYSIGFAQSHYEIWAIPAILVVSYIFIPIYRKGNFFTLSQFLENRYNSHARLIYTILMVAFILIQLIGGFYIGSRTLGILFLDSAFEINYLTGIFIIALVTVIFTVFGGMESVVVADNILTVIMIISVVLIGTLTYMQPEINGLWGLLKLDHANANKMHLYLPSNHSKLPWPGIFSGLTILNLFYWTTNQYQVQRVLAAETDKDAKLGSITAGFLKLIIPFFSIAAGSAAFYIFKARFGEGVVLPDDTFLTLLKTVVPRGYGFVGLILAGLLCAIFSAIYSMMNSVSTMMAYDVYKKYISKNASDKKTVLFGKFSVVVICLVAVLLAYLTYDPTSKDNFFLVLANQTSYIKPGLVVAFFWGVLWSKTNAKAAVISLILCPIYGFLADFVYNNYLNQIPFFIDLFGEKLNFLYRVFIIFVLGSSSIYVLSLFFNKQKNNVIGKYPELSIPIGGLLSAISKAAMVHVPIIICVLLGVISPQIASLPASIFTFLIFVYYINLEKSDWKKFYTNDVFYAGLLSSAMVFIMYFFA